MWLQRWLGETYSILYQAFARGTFSSGDAEPLLTFSDSMKHVAFSKLHSAGALIVFERRRPRVYRLLDPRSLTLATAGGLRMTGDSRILQERYSQLACDAFRAVRSKFNLFALSVFGSVARGDAKPESDIDVLVVSDNFQGSVASRIDDLSFVSEESEEELDFLKVNGINTSLSFLPLRREELEASPMVLLDLTAHARVLYDPADVLGAVLRSMRAKLELAGSRRVQTSRGWYWDLKPDYRPGEEVVI